MPNNEANLKNKNLERNNSITNIIFNQSIFTTDPESKRYIDLPIKYYPNSAIENALEYHTGAYNYLFSKDGYTKLTSVVNLSNSTLSLSNDGTRYNGYVLFNHQSIDQIDIGLSIRHIDNEVLVQPFYYYMGGSAPKVFYLDKLILSKYASLANNTFKCNDIFKFELQTINTGWYFKIEVLGKDIIYEKNVEIFDNIHQHKLGRFLVGASLVPIKEPLWNPLCGASLKQVFFESVILNDHTLLYPSSPSMYKGYSQGYPFSHYTLLDKSFIFETIYK